MRFLCFVFLLVFVAALGLFAYYNQQDLTLRLFDRDLTAPAAVILGAAYLLGMLSGWSVWGMLRRSIRGVSNYADDKLLAGGR